MKKNLSIGAPIAMNHTTLTIVLLQQFINQENDLMRRNKDMWQVKRFYTGCRCVDEMQAFIARLDKEALKSVIFDGGFWFVIYWDGMKILDKAEQS